MRVAVVLLNLGAPDKPESVEPFLQNLFSDPAIIRLPAFLRLPLAKFIAKRRAPRSRAMYKKIGGCSPLLANTKAQAEALEKELGEGFKTFIAMRYWHPLAAETRREVEAYAPDKTVLLPLYPQFSTTTTASSVGDLGLTRATTLCCYPTEPGFAESMAELCRPHLEKASKFGRPRVLFSAHGLPEKIVAAGDPYQWQCEQTAKAILEKLNHPQLDWVNCYQSRVGPLEWIGPSTEAEIRRAGAEKRPILVVPISFVSEHSETLVELDIDYKNLAAKSSVPFFARVPTVSTHPKFIGGLARLVRAALDQDRPVCSHEGKRLCPAAKECPHG